MVKLNSLLRAERHSSARDKTPPRVHLDAYTCSNGASNLLHDPKLAEYDKSEELKKGQYSSFAYLLTHEPELHATAFDTVKSISGWAGVEVQLRQYLQAVSKASVAPLLKLPDEGLVDWGLRLLPARPRLREQVYIMKNKSVRRTV